MSMKTPVVRKTAHDRCGGSEDTEGGTCLSANGLSTILDVRSDVAKCSIHLQSQVCDVFALPFHGDIIK